MCGPDIDVQSRVKAFQGRSSSFFSNEKKMSAIPLHLAQHHIEQNGRGWSPSVHTAKAFFQNIPQWTEQEQRALGLLPVSTVASVVVSRPQDCKSLVTALDLSTQQRLHDALQLSAICDWIREQKDDATVALVHKTLVAARKGHVFENVVHGNKTCVLMRKTRVRTHLLPVDLEGRVLSSNAIALKRNS
jgi:hypothetical protein